MKALTEVQTWWVLFFLRVDFFKAVLIACRAARQPDAVWKLSEKNHFIYFDRIGFTQIGNTNQLNEKYAVNR